MDKTTVEKRNIPTVFALYLAVVAGSDTSELDYSDLDPQRADATIVLAKQTKQDHDVLSQEELEEELAELLGGETYDDLYNRLSTLEGNLQTMRERAQNAEYKLDSANRGSGAFIGFLTSALRGRPAYDRLVMAGGQSDLVALGDLAGQTIKAQDEEMLKLGKSLTELAVKEVVEVADKANAKVKENTYIIARAMGVPPANAKSLSVEVLVEALHNLLCPDDGSIVVDGHADEPDGGRHQVVKDTVTAAYEKVQGQKPEETAAAKARAEYQNSRRGNPLAALLGLGGPGGPGGLMDILGGMSRVRRGPAGLNQPRSGDEAAMEAGLERLFSAVMSGRKPDQGLEDELNGLFGGRVRVQRLDPRALGMGENGGALKLEPTGQAGETAASKLDGIDTKDMTSGQIEHLENCGECREEARERQAQEKAEGAEQDE